MPLLIVQVPSSSGNGLSRGVGIIGLDLGLVSRVSLPPLGGGSINEVGIDADELSDELPLVSCEPSSIVEETRVGGNG